MTVKYINHCRLTDDANIHRNKQRSENHLLVFCVLFSFQLKGFYGFNDECMFYNTVRKYDINKTKHLITILHSLN